MGSTTGMPPSGLILRQAGSRDAILCWTYRGLVAGYRTHALCMGCNMRKPAEVER